MLGRNYLFFLLPDPDVADRMKKSNRAAKSHPMSWLAIAGFAFGVSGCATPLTQNQSLPAPGGFVTNTTAQQGTPAAAQAPAFASLSDTTTGTPATGTTATVGDMSSAPFSAPQTSPGMVSDQPAGQVPLGGVRQASGTERYTARQYPQPPMTGPVLPQTNDYTQPQANSLGGTGMVDPYAPVPAYPVGPRVREADLVINGYPARTGRVILGGAVNSDAGLTGNLTVDERNFDITRWPRSFQDLFSGTAFRGAGQTFRIEAAPGTDFKRYTMQFADPNLFGYKPVSMSVSGFLFDRRFNDWDEQRLGGRLAFGYRITPDLSVAFGVSGQNVEVSRPRVVGVPQLDDVVGDNELYTGEITLKHDTRDTPLQASRGHYFEFKFEEAFGDYDYARFELEYRKFWLLAERADRTGRQTISYSTQVGFSGEETPIFENFFAGGYATLRGFDFRGASPVVGGVEVGGRFQWLNSVEYMFPITADDAFRGVAFVDFGTVEQDITIDKDNFRVAPGVGLRVAVPMLGPAPLAFDFAYPLSEADTDQRRIFSFYMSLIN